MSEQGNNMVNGPSVDNSQRLQDMTKFHPNGNGTGPPISGYPNNPTPRPLARVDSRSTLQFRPPYPNQPQRPPIIRQNLPPGAQLPHNAQYRAPVPGARPPGQPPFPQGQGVPVPRPNVNPNIRPATPYPRPQQQPPPPRTPLIQQKSVPAFGQQISEQIERSQTLDSSDYSDVKAPDDGRNIQAEARPHLASMPNRSFSLSSNPPEPSIMEERRRSSTASSDGRRSISGSIENIDKKSEHEYHSRPESRSSSRMDKIEERRNITGAQDINKQEPRSPEPTSKVNEPTRQESHPLQKTRSPSKESVTDEHKIPLTKPSEPPHTQVNGKKEDTPRDKSPTNKVASPISSMKAEDVKDKDITRTKSPVNKGETRAQKNESQDSRKIDNAKNSKPDVAQLDLKNMPQKRLNKKDGDNDSGVDESTQGNDQSSNGDQHSPRKSAGKPRSATMTPTKNRSLSRGSKSPSLKSPDSNATTPGSVGKKLPMNKIQVGSAPSPNLKVVKSKINSLENASYRPGGGHVKIESKKLDFKKAAPRIEAKNEKYAPKGGEKKIQQQKLQWNAKSKIGSLENAHHKPKGGDKKIETVKLDFKDKAKPKVGSKDNMKHVPGGGDIKSQDEKAEATKDIENRKIDVKVQSKIGSLDNMKHKPGGGDKKIFDDKEYLKQRSTISSENHSLSGSQDKDKRQKKTVVIHEVFNMKEESKHILETVEEEMSFIASRPSSRLSRSGSARSKKCDSARAPWRY